MSNTCLRFFDSGMVDKLSKTAQWLPIWPKYGDGAFTTTDGNKASLNFHNEGFYEFSKDSALYNDTSYDFGDKNFTISFWLSFKDDYCNTDSEIVGNKVILYTEDTNDYISYDITPDTEWHHYAFVRIDNNIRFYIDGDLKHTLNTTASFNLDSNSYLYVGNPMINCIGDEFYCDDVYMVAEIALWNTSTFTPPSRYLNADIYYRLFENAKNDPTSQHNFYGLTTTGVSFDS